MIYFDSSAILVRLFREQFADDLTRYLQSFPPDTPTCTSTIGYIEVDRAIWRVGATNDLRMERDTLLADFDRMEITNQVRQMASDFPTPHLRALDAIHIASAYSLSDQLTVMLSYDKRMIDAAAAAGIKVASPGLGR